MQPAGGGEIHQHHPGKADQAADELPAAELFLPVEQAGDKNADKNIGGHHNGDLDPRGVGAADIKEGVLNDGLEHGQHADFGKGAFLRQQQLSAQEAAQQHGQYPRQSKAGPGKEDQGGDMVRPDLEQAVANLDHRRGAAPEQIGKQRQGHHHDCLLHGFFVELHFLSFLLRFQRAAPWGQPVFFD